MVKKCCLTLFIVLFAVSLSFAGEEEVISEGEISAQNYTSPNHAMFDRAHMCSYFTTDCDVPGSYTLTQPRFQMRFWAPASQSYTRHYFIADTAGTLLSYEYFSSYISSGWTTRTYDPGITLSNGDYIFSTIWQGTDGRAAIKSYRFAVQ